MGIGRALRRRLCTRKARPVFFATDIDRKGPSRCSAKDGVLRKVGAASTVRDSAAVADMAKRVGKIDILLNAAGLRGITATGAGMLGRRPGIFSFDLKRQGRCTGPSGRFSFCRPCWNPAHGSIVNIASAAGVFKAAPNRYVYGATKAAVRRA